MTPIILQGVQHFCPQTCFCSIHVGMGRTADFFCFCGVRNCHTSLSGHLYFILEGYWGHTFAT